MSLRRYKHQPPAERVRRATITLLMKNSTYSYTYTAELSITHPTRELSYLAKELQTIPIGTVGKGMEKEDIVKPDIPYDERKTNRISFELNYNWNNALVGDDLPTAIGKIVDAVQPHKASLLELTSEGGNLSMRIGWHMDSNIGMGLSKELVQKLADLNISLDFFVYMAQEQQDRHTAQVDQMSEKIRAVVHKYDPSGVIDRAAPLNELHHDPYQDLFDVIPYLIKAHASKEVLEQELKEELPYFNRTNTPALKDFTNYEALATELAALEWE